MVVPATCCVPCACWLGLTPAGGGGCRVSPASTVDPAPAAILIIRRFYRPPRRATSRSWLFRPAAARRPGLLMVVADYSLCSVLTTLHSFTEDQWALYRRSLSPFLWRRGPPPARARGTPR